jgi:hypothetical protein
MQRELWVVAARWGECFRVRVGVVAATLYVAGGQCGVGWANGQRLKESLGPRWCRPDSRAGHCSLTVPCPCRVKTKLAVHAQHWPSSRAAMGRLEMYKRPGPSPSPGVPRLTTHPPCPSSRRAKIFGWIRPVEPTGGIERLHWHDLGGPVPCGLRKINMMWPGPKVCNSCTESQKRWLVRDTRPFRCI